MRLVLQISSLPVVQRVIALGTLCAIELRAEGADAGYAAILLHLLIALHVFMIC